MFRAPPSWIIVTCDGCPIVLKQKLFVQIQKSNHYTSQLFKMAAPRKFENQNKRFWNSFISDTNDSIGKRLNNFDCKRYVE